MKIKGITFKLFLLTALLFSVFLVVILLGQSLFFERFYINKKTAEVEQSIKELIPQYQASQLTLTSKNSILREFTRRTNTQVALLDKASVYQSIYDYYLTVETEGKQLVRVPLNNINNLEKLSALDLKKGNQVKLKGFFFGKNKEMFNMTALSAEGKDWKQLENALVLNGTLSNAATYNKLKIAYVTLDSKRNKINFVDAYKLEGADGIDGILIEEISQEQTVEGKITEYVLPQITGFAAQYREEVLKDAVQSWLLLAKSKNISLDNREVLRYDYHNSINGSNSAVFVLPIYEKGAIKETLLFLTPLQPVNEAVAALRDYYIYIFILALALLLLLSLLLSKMISKPLIHITEAAARMCNLDFSRQLPVKSSDEIGSLSQSINSLSGSLKKNIDDLRNANIKLQQDIEKERQLDILRKEFISGVSHELKTPISIIQSYAEGIKDTVSQERKDKYVSVILDESEKMNRLVLDMLELSKLESGQRKPSYTTFYLDELAGDLIERFSYSFKEKNIKPSMQCSTGPIILEADEILMEQVLANLIDNAIKYSTASSEVLLSIQQSEEHIECSIENSGVYLPEDKMPKLWDKFYRLEESRDRKSGGTGLGLSIVKNILELHGFAYGAENTEKGVRFYFTCNRRNSSDM